MRYEIFVYDKYLIWNKNNLYHRLYGPTYEHSVALTIAIGFTMWWKNGRMHREDGPSSEYVNGTKTWHIDGKKYTEEEFNRVKYEIRS